jgi:hypothetical protein
MPRSTLVPLLLSTTAVAAVQPALARAPDAAARVATLTADRAVVPPGGALTLRGRGFPRNAHVALLARRQHGTAATRVGGANTGRNGSFSATIHVRPRSSAGRFVLLACHDRCSVQASAAFRIVAP